MKKYLIGLIAFFGMVGIARAGLFSYEEDKIVTVKYDLTVAAATTSTDTVIIDLSDTTNWPHDSGKFIVIDGVDLNLDKASASTCTVKLGVVNFVNASTGSVTWFYEKSFLTNVTTDDPSDFKNYKPFSIRCKVVNNTGATDGSTPYLFSNDTTAGSTTYQNDVDLPSPYDSTTPPGEGDIILHVDAIDSAAIQVNMTLFYHTDKR